MRFFFITCLMSLVGLTASAQFADYQNIYEMQAAKNAPAQTVYGYLATSNGWVRLTLQVKGTSNSVMVVGYKQKDTSSYGGAFSTYGNPSPWRSCQAFASPVSIYSDGQQIASNFDFKVSISGLGIVYF